MTVVEPFRKYRCQKLRALVWTQQTLWPRSCSSSRFLICSSNVQLQPFLPRFRDSENSSCLFPQFFLASLRSSRPRHRGISSARTFYVVTETGSWPRCSSSAGPQPPPQHWFSLLPRTGFKVHHHQGFSIPMAPDIAFFLFHLQFMAMTSQDLILQ